MSLSPTLAFLVNYLDLPEAVGDPAASWEAFQLRHLNSLSILDIETKARQVGWSWLAAAESVASACLTPRIPHIFVSINQEEAAEKIRYARQIIECLDHEVRPRLIHDNQLELELENGSRLISHPCRPPRGKAKAHVYLDEFAHYPNDREVYQAALPVITKGGILRIGSSPLGARGLFWEIFTESLRTFPGYTRAKIPWWAVRAMCKDTRSAMLLAPSMPTDERVRAFGSERLLQIYENMLLEDFQQEYECLWNDETVSWIDWDLIKRNQGMAVDGRLWYRKVSGVDAAMNAITEARGMSAIGKIEPTMVGGMDIGRTHDTTEIILCGRNEHLQSLPYRLHITLDRVEFDNQRAVAEAAITQLPVTGFLIDSNGIGMQLAEQLSVYPQVEAANFTNSTKALWAIETKLRFQRGQVPIPLERDLMYQIHSVRKKVTEAANATYENNKSEGHHADMFWALALAIWAGREEAAATVTVKPSPLKGRRG